MTSLLKQLLKLNPLERSTPKECLKNPMFDEFRNPELEQDAKWHVKLPLDDELTINYDSQEDLKSVDALVEVLIKEIEASN